MGSEKMVTSISLIAVLCLTCAADLVSSVLFVVVMHDRNVTSAYLYVKIRITNLRLYVDIPTFVSCPNNAPEFHMHLNSS